jgi:hypothetical protein
MRLNTNVRLIAPEKERLSTSQHSNLLRSIATSQFDAICANEMPFRPHLVLVGRVTFLE